MNIRHTLWLLAFTAVAVLLVNLGADQLEERRRSEAVQRANERIAEATEERSRRGRYCTEDKKALIERSGVVASQRYTAGTVEVFVNPSAWSALDYRARERMALYFSHCSVEKESGVAFMHAQTGRKLAGYGLLRGYVAYE